MNIFSLGTSLNHFVVKRRFNEIGLIIETLFRKDVLSELHLLGQFVHTSLIFCRLYE